MPKQSDEKEYKNKDLSDFYMLFINTGRKHEFKAAFEQLVENAKLIEDVFPEILSNEINLNEERLKEEYDEVNFYDSIKEQYINKPITFRAIVRGEAQKPYIYPTRVRVSCNFGRGESCKGCGLFLTGGTTEIKLDTISPLELIDCNESQKNNLIKRKVGIMQCGQFSTELVEQRYIQELFLSPAVEDVTLNINPENIEERKEQRFIVRHAFSEGSGIIPNKAYQFYGFPTASPKNQSLVYYLKENKMEENDLDNFNLTDEDIEHLKIFIPEKDEGSDSVNIERKLKHIYNDFNYNLSPIIRFRDDIMLACDLSFHSVLHFWFGNSHEKGWVECLIIGDTSTGKTKISTKLIKHYRLGVIQGAENSTIAGLIGGMTRFESINIMTWGLLPLNNSRLIILDEASGIKREVLEELTRIRSEGIAERTIVGGTSMTASKVRLIWLSNPRKRAMNMYDNGCEIVKELVGKEEDISRFDFILTVREDEVPIENINNLRTFGDNSNKPRHIYLSEYCNKLVLWAWSHKANQIVFDKDVEELILHYSIRMSRKYTPNFPLVIGSTIRLKIAKLSIALAARLFSTPEDDYNSILVTQDHVTFIYDFLERIYSKSSFGYDEYSRFHKEDNHEPHDTKDEIMKEIKVFVTSMTSFIKNMLRTSYISFIDLKDFAQCDKEKADKLRTLLVSNGLLIKKQGIYVKSQPFREMLRKEINKDEKETNN